MLRFIVPCVLPLLSACGWEAPIDPDAGAVLNSIEGTVMVSGNSSPGYANIIVFAADDPPPPYGTGSPLTFSTVPPDAFTGAATTGFQSAPFGVTQLPDGDYLLAAWIDNDGDFSAFFSATAGATCGDDIGRHVVDTASGEWAVVTVAGGELVEGVTILAEQELEYERPAFEFLTEDRADGFSGINEIDLDEAIAGNNQLFTLVATGIDTEEISLEGPWDGEGEPDACEVFVPWYLVEDPDQPGLPLAHPLYGDLSGIAYLVWPRIYAQYLGDGDVALLSEDDVYATEAIVLPTALWTGDVVPGGIFNTTEITAVFAPGVQHFLPDGTVEVLYDDDVPRGSYAITLMNHHGQTWTVPNEIPDFSLGEGFDPTGQTQFLTVY